MHITNLSLLFNRVLLLIHSHLANLKAEISNYNWVVLLEVFISSNRTFGSNEQTYHELKLGAQSIWCIHFWLTSHHPLIERSGSYENKLNILQEMLEIFGGIWEIKQLISSSTKWRQFWLCSTCVGCGLPAEWKLLCVSCVYLYSVYEV